MSGSDTSPPTPATTPEPAPRPRRRRRLLVRLTLGAVVAREMGYRSIPVAKIEPEEFSSLPAAARVEWSGGEVRIS